MGFVVVVVVGLCLQRGYDYVISVCNDLDNEAIPLTIFFVIRFHHDLHLDHHHDHHLDHYLDDHHDHLDDCYEHHLDNEVSPLAILCDAISS